MFKTSANAQGYSVNLYNFETGIKLTQTQSKLTDSFHLRVLPFAESAGVITLTYRKCQQVEFPPLPTGVTNLSQHIGTHVCLRKPVKGVMPRIMHLEISLLSNTTEYQTSFLGNLTFHTNLCLSESWLRSMHLRLSDIFEGSFRFTPCSGKKHNTGEDMLIWKAELTTELFTQSNNKLYISLPGNIFYSDLSLSSSGKVCADDYMLKYRWFTEEQLGFVPRKYLDPNRDLKLFEIIGTGVAFTGTAGWTLNFLNTLYTHKYTLLFRDLEGDHNEPLARTWYQADEMCRGLKSNLPNIVSSQDLEDLKEYVRMAASSVLITDIFIGIYGKVM